MSVPSHSESKRKKVELIAKILMKSVKGMGHLVAIDIAYEIVEALEKEE